jgi:hypothetical protein
MVMGSRKITGNDKVRACGIQKGEKKGIHVLLKKIKERAA